MLLASYQQSKEPSIMANHPEAAVVVDAMELERLKAEGQQMFGPDGVSLLYGPDVDYGVHGPIGAFEIDVDFEDNVKLGTTLVGSAIGAAILALILGGRSRVLAALAGAGGAVAGGMLTSVISNQIITYKRVAPTPLTTIDPKIIATAKELEGSYW